MKKMLLEAAEGGEERTGSKKREGRKEVKKEENKLGKY